MPEARASSSAPAQHAATVIEARAVAARYGEGPRDGKRDAGRQNGSKASLEDVSLQVGPGEVVCVLGPNGAGKSTLLHVLSGALLPSAGEVRLQGHPLASLSRREVARALAVVPQTSDVAFGFSVRDVVRMGRAPHQDGWLRPSAADENAVENALACCDLAQLAARPASELSGGEQKRVAIARALAQEPSVLLLDEPGAFLDIRHQLALHDLLAEQGRARGLACVVALHDLTLAAQYATRVLLLKEGRVVALGAVPEVMTYRLLRDTFDADLYVGVNELSGARFFVPMSASAPRP